MTPVIMKTVLVAFHSRTGHTAEVAQNIAAGLNADVEQLREAEERAYFRAGLDALLGRTCDLAGSITSPGNYDLVVLGTPVWAMNLPPPMRSYIVEHAGELPKVAFFCTEGGGGGNRVFGQMARLCGKSPLATLEVTEPEMKSGTSESKIKGFIDALSQKLAD